MSKLKNMDLTTKIILIVLTVIFSFLLLFLFLSELFLQENTLWGGMMNHMNSTPDYTVAILLSLTLALLAGVLISFWLKPTITEPAPAAKKTDELEIIKRALSDDEKAVLDEIRRAGEITQDSLRFRLDWSKPKLSRILTNLDKMNIIQRERLGKTYKVFISKEHSEP